MSADLSIGETFRRLDQRRADAAAEVRELAARFVVADAYDEARARRRYDMTAGRRRVALYRLERDLNQRRDDARRYGVADEDLVSRREDTVAAVLELARRRLQRHDAQDAVVDSVAEVARAFDVPAALELVERRRAANAERYGGGRTGGSRARR